MSNPIIDGMQAGSLEAAAVPVFITNLKVRAECPREAGHGLRGFADATLSGSTEYTADIVFGDQECNGPMVEVTGIRCRIVGEDLPKDTTAVVVKERYGFLETAPCLQLASAEGLLKYLEERRQGRSVADKFLVLGEIIHLVAHASPNATILELSEGQRSTAIEFLSSLGTPIGESLRSIRWTVANLNPDIREALTPGTDNVVFDTLSTTLDLKSPTSNRPKQDIILVTSGWLANIEEERLELIKATLKDTGHLIVSPSAPDTSNVLTTLRSSKFFDKVIEIPRYDPEAENKTTFVVAAKTKYISSFPAIESVVLLLPKEASERTLWLASEITWHFISHGITVHRQVLQAGSVDLAYGAQCLSLLELECPLPLDTDPNTFDMVKKLTLQATRLLWVAGTSDPRLSIMTGLIRTVRNENPSLDFVSLALGHVSPNNVTTAAQSIKEVFVTDSDDKEFILEDGLCCVSRYFTDRALNANIVSQRAQEAKKLVTISGVSSGLQLETPKPAQPHTWSFKLDHESQSDLLPDEVEIETRAVGTNSPDVVTIKGQRPNYFHGQAASGLVARIGSAVTGFHAGDRIFQLSSRPFKTRLRASEKLCQLNPHGMSFVEAASIPLALCAALRSVRDMGILKAGETILIHAGASNIGQAAIQVAQYLQAEVFTTVTSLLEQEVLCKQYGIAEDHVFSCMDVSFVQSVKKATRGKGVDVILNCLEGDLLRQSWSCTAHFGRFVHLGTRRLGDGASLDMTPFLRGATFACFNCDLMLNEQSEKLSVLLEESTVMIRQGVIKPKQTVKDITATTLFVDSHALQHVETGDDVIVSISPDDKIPVHHSALDVVRLRQDATYIIVGGLGGLGRSQALRMAESGAGCILLLSRLGSSDPKAKSLCEELESRGARAVCWSCDVADATQLRAALDQCAVELPLIKGCIQGAMVLRDGIFETMTHDDFRTSLRPKVQGTWNLHEQLPKELDFFIMLSSISGVTGNPGQANYAAGNTFMDALAHYRQNMGLPAISIDLGLMLDVGFVAERQGVSNLKKWESVGLLEEEYLAIMAAAMQGALPAPAGGDRYDLPAQIVTGLATGGHVVSHGLDDPFYFADARFKRLVRAELSDTDAGDSSSDTESLQQLLEASSSVTEAADIIAEVIRQRLGRVIDKNPENIELGKPLHAYGIDSLMAVEVRNWLAKEMHCSIGLFDIMGSPSIRDLAVKITATSKLVQGLLTRAN